MRLRPSMKKFDVPNIELAEIEIVQPFGYPINAYLNRCLFFTSPLLSFMTLTRSLGLL